MINGVYIRIGSDGVESGVDRKIKEQIKVLSTCSNIELITVKKTKTNVIRHISSRLPGRSALREYDEVYTVLERLGDLDYIYTRGVALDRGYLKFWKTIKEMYPKCHIIFEVPTYPYEKELLKNKTMWPWYFKDIFCRGRLHKSIDRIATLTEERVIFDIPTLRIFNGCDVDNIVPVRSDKQDDVIRMIVVAMMQPYHGYERIIKGLSTYYRNGGTRDIELYMVGYGKESDYYKKLTMELGLSDKVIFKGKLVGKELDDVYNDVDLAIGSLGEYKIGIYLISSIKVGEYLAKGLPVITGGKYDIFEKYGKQYELEFPNDETELDVGAIVGFYDRIYQGKEKQQVHGEIRKFAKETVDIEVAMKEVVDYVSELLN